jgi:hypothetical protein
MKWHLIFFAAFGLSNASCEKHKALNQELLALDATMLKEKAVMEQLDKNILSLGGPEGAEKLRLRLEPLRKGTIALEEQNAARLKKWEAVEKEFSKIKPAAEAFKAALPQ